MACDAYCSILDAWPGVFKCLLNTGQQTSDLDWGQGGPKKLQNFPSNNIIHTCLSVYIWVRCRHCYWRREGELTSQTWIPLMCHLSGHLYIYFSLIFTHLSSRAQLLHGLLDSYCCCVRSCVPFDSLFIRISHCLVLRSELSHPLALVLPAQSSSSQATHLSPSPPL